MALTPVAAALRLVAVRLAPRRRQALIPLLLVVLLEWSRVYLQIDQPGDVRAGTVAAAGRVAGSGDVDAAAADA